jgi:hypothetical protein
MSNGFIYVVDAHFIDKIEENKCPGLKCLCFIGASFPLPPAAQVYFTVTTWAVDFDY